MKNIKKLNNFALITGGSRGIGKSIAEELAGKGYDILIASLPDDEIDQTKAEIEEKYGVFVDVKLVDLTKEDGPESVFQWCEENNYILKILVNNAGIGYTGPFETFEVSFYESLLKLNVLSTVKLTRLFSKMLIKNSPSYILNVASLASFYDMPFKTVYSSSKGFIYSFSRALREEFKSKGVSISVLCPGGVITTDKIEEAVKSLNFIGKSTIHTAKAVGEIGIKGLFKKKAYIIPGLMNKILFGLNYVIPYPIQMRIMKSQLKKYKQEANVVPEIEVLDSAGNKKESLSV
ncbi:MAG: SDR family NAD(P)-dependent oxidoreductase [Cyclobacteriaceae bacterium]|nr:SDR family NAD(P)-dependent oxidoreductase [Cyclobacteriaceae bacterium]